MKTLLTVSALLACCARAQTPAPTPDGAPIALMATRAADQAEPTAYEIVLDKSDAASRYLVWADAPVMIVEKSTTTTADGTRLSSIRHYLTTRRRGVRMPGGELTVIITPTVKNKVTRILFLKGTGGWITPEAKDPLQARLAEAIARIQNLPNP